MILGPGINEARAALAEHMDGESLWPPGESAAVLACSAGLDSNTLAHLLGPLLQARGHRVALAHINHGWRGEASERDALAVEALATALGVEFLGGRGGGRDAPRRGELGQEGAARAERRQFLRACAGELKASTIYLAHHRDDHVETLLLRAEDGAEPKRNCGLFSRKGPWFRPLLPWGRSDLLRLAQSAGWTWCEDATNGDLRFARNRIRHEVIPQLREESPEALRALLDSARVAQVARAEQLEQVRGVWGRVVSMGPFGPVEEAGAPGSEVDAQAARSCRCLVRAALAALDDDLAILLLQHLLPPAQSDGRLPSRVALGALLELCRRPPGRARLFDLGAGWTARILNEAVEIAPESLGLEAGVLSDSPVSGPSSPIPTDPPVLVHRFVLAKEARRLLQVGKGAGRSFAIFDADTVQPPFRFVPCGSGRKMQPWGMQGRKSLRNLLAEAGIPRPQRAAWPVAVDAEGRVLWLPQIRASEHGSLQRASRRAVLLYTGSVFDPGNRLRTRPRDQ